MWFRQDLRLFDNRALTAALRGSGPVVPVYVLDDDTVGPWAMGGASRWWLHGSLTSLANSLAAIGSRLILRRGRAIDTLMALVAETGAASIHCTRAYEPHAAGLELELKARCEQAGATLRRYTGNLLHEPEAVTTRAGEPFKVFTPFWRSLMQSASPARPAPRPAALPVPETWPHTERLDDWSLRPHRPDWAGGLRASWTPGEAGADARLRTLIDDVLAGYADRRDRPDVPGTSQLSPHLHFGEVSPAQCWHAVQAACAGDADLEKGPSAFLRELGWREFSHHLLHHWPHITDQPFRPEFAAFPWEPDAGRADEHFTAWSRGLTGYPIVDAGMRQLWQTGFMHNRVRMIAASFLTKHLRIPWQRGARWFWDTLVDADLASNSASWQWVAGSGADAAPYFRIFNPVLQGRKFDPDGAYVRRYVPELARLHLAHIHAPWEAPHAELAAAGIHLGETYPRPVVDHATARAAALAAHGAMRNKS